jgi:two-component system, chemotaxis family, chemotaxis protein CheY
MKILIVDDSSTMRRILKTQLEGIGSFTMLEAANGDEAIGILQNNMPIDIMMLDWNMPVMDGMTCLQTIRRDPLYKDVRIVMCTSESEKTKVVEAIKEGANNYIVKPFTAETVKEKLGL